MSIVVTGRLADWKRLHEFLEALLASVGRPMLLFRSLRASAGPNCSECNRVSVVVDGRLSGTAHVSSAHTRLAATNVTNETSRPTPGSRPSRAPPFPLRGGHQRCGTEQASCCGDDACLLGLMTDDLTPTLLFASKPLGAVLDQAWQTMVDGDATAIAGALVVGSPREPRMTLAWSRAHWTGETAGQPGAVGILLYC